MFGGHQVSADGLAETPTGPAGVVAVSQPSVTPPATEVTGEATSSEANGKVEKRIRLLKQKLLLSQSLQKMQLHLHRHLQIQVPLQRNLLMQLLRQKKRLKETIIPVL